MPDYVRRHSSGSDLTYQLSAHDAQAHQTAGSVPPPASRTKARQLIERGTWRAVAGQFSRAHAGSSMRGNAGRLLAAANRGDRATLQCLTLAQRLDFLPCQRGTRTSSWRLLPLSRGVDPWTPDRELKPLAPSNKNGRQTRTRALLLCLGSTWT
jgi:hypothetical protein